jgi:osmoprotectant transport system ATP-binding protein
MSDPATSAALVLEHLSKWYGAVRAVDDVSLAVEAGECLALVGESGSGKTTLLCCVNRLIEPDAGRVIVWGRDARDRDPTELRREIGYVPQDGGLLPHWRVRRNVALVPWLRGDGAALDRADEALALVGLDPRVIGARWPHELSGGERQRVAVARALAGGQALLLLDEPFGALDAITRSELHRMVEALRDRLGPAVVLVTHDLQEAARLGDRVAVLRRGHLLQVGPLEVLRASPEGGYVAELLARSGMGAV